MSPELECLTRLRGGSVRTGTRSISVPSVPGREGTMKSDRSCVLTPPTLLELRELFDEADKADGSKYLVLADSSAGGDTSPTDRMSVGSSGTDRELLLLAQRWNTDGTCGEQRIRRAEGEDCEEGEDVSSVFSDDESHYISTHEIQLCEGDSDPGVDSPRDWDSEDGHQLFSFVDYASFECDGAGEQQQQQQQQQQQIHLSITTTSINDHVQEEENIIYRARSSGDLSRYVLRGLDGKSEPLRDGAAPGGANPGGTRRDKDVTEFSSGTSSAVSELDDADKEVRSLTARAFKSLAYPYWDALNLSTSSESSASERGLNRWSAFVGVKYGPMNVQGQTGARSNATSTNSRSYKGIVLASSNAPSSRMFTLNDQKVHLMGKVGGGHTGLITLTETLNFRCNVKAGMSAGETRTDFAQNSAGSRSTDEVTGSLSSGQRRRDSQAPWKAMEDTHKKAIFASSLIKNVISKKMQFEQEQKMERGEIREPGGSLPHRHPEPGDLVDGVSSEAKSDSRRPDAAAAAAGTSREPTGAGFDSKKGALEATKRTLLRSQNSAFRCWGEEELELQKAREKEQSPEEDEQPPGAEREQSTQPTKMSHLFVPSIQLLPSDGEVRPRNCSLCADERDTLRVTHSRTSTSKSPEIKINLRSVRDDKPEPLGVSRLRTGSLVPADPFKALKAESADKVPHFMVRDIRDNKAKLQTPIHQVRDVRKLVKSSYHFVSLDGDSCSAADGGQEPRRTHRKPTSPIVIKCQSVNINSNGKQAANADLSKCEGVDVSKPPAEGDKGAAVQRQGGKAPVVTCCPSTDDQGSSRMASKRPEKLPDVAGKKVDAANQVALEKLQAAVKTMEQLYVFEKNEWKRKDEPQPLVDSHVLPLIAREEHSSSDDDGAKVDANWTPSGDFLLRGEERDGPHDRSRVRAGQRIEGQHTFSLNSKASASIGAMKQPVPPAPFNAKSFTPKSPRLPVSLQINPMKPEGPEPSASADNYLTIPVKSPAAPADRTSKLTLFSRSQPTSPPADAGRQEEPNRPPRRSSIVMETCSPDIPSATVYHSVPLGVSTGLSQVYCFSPAVTPAPSLEPFQTTQRKVLLDPATGGYYLVDTPVQPATKRLFDPESGQYVDVPMPQHPMTPVPVPISPLAISPGAYGHTYMIYPGFVPTPSVIPARAMAQSQMSVQAEVESVEKAAAQPTEGVYMESPFYMTTGKSQVVAGTQGANRATQPFISITSQQGPRIIAPPSFDGTTMSFVVEHR
ncbi:uncharacterized protein C4orf54 homolog [Lampetra planeri]